MSSSGIPEWAVGDFDDEPAVPLLDQDDDDQDDDGEGLVPFSTAWWTQALVQEPLTGSVAERRRIRACVAAAVGLEPGSGQLAALESLLMVVNTSSSTTSATTSAATGSTTASDADSAGGGCCASLLMSMLASPPMSTIDARRAPPRLRWGP
ncbi:hypothetical protein, partial [Quadrisphaera granulorum]|uniref:hypothetical protein n=1 Tax=Quadrisphaera granulorum TaxID=317664 RepID=UPI001B87A22D